MNDTIRRRLLSKAKELRSQSPEWICTQGYTARAGADLANDLENHPHAFVLGCVMDRQIKAERAWKIPDRIRDRLGTFNFSALATLSLEKVDHLFHEPDTLHRFHNEMPKFFHAAVQRIATEYDGDASEIWSGNVESDELVRRFKQFKGVGQKIATMAVNILVRDFQIELADQDAIDISVDVHVERVFRRLGLVHTDASPEKIITVAQEMNPLYPGIFDLPVWQIGREWCHSEDPECPACYMNDVCPSAGRFHPELAASS